MNAINEMLNKSVVAKSEASVIWFGCLEEIAVSPTGKLFVCLKSAREVRSLEVTRTAAVGNPNVGFMIDCVLFFASEVIACSQEATEVMAVPKS